MHLILFEADTTVRPIPDVLRSGDIFGVSCKWTALQNVQIRQRVTGLRYSNFARAWRGYSIQLHIGELNALYKNQAPVQSPCLLVALSAGWRPESTETNLLAPEAFAKSG
jgi:hypothetical protein